MKEIIKVESKRILKTGMLLVFFGAVFVLSITSSYQAVKSYEIWDINGFVAEGKDNLEHGKKFGACKEIEEAIGILAGAKEEAVFVNETNIEKLVNLNYAGRTAKDLSNAQINSFFENRLRTIAQSLDESRNIAYTENEKKQILKEAGELTSLRVGWAEGWKVLNGDMGSVLPIVLVIISILLMPLFADDAQTKMKELSRSSQKGKRTLDLARMITAFGIGSMLYVSAILFFFLIKMVPFGFSGGSEYIQSSADTFYSVFHITYLEQFIGNCIRGYAALVFIVSLTIMISVILERIMVGIVVTCFYWILLLVMEKMQQFEVNHWFANFMPLRLAGSMEFYIRNEIYRFAGNSFNSIVWCPVAALILSVIIVGVSTAWQHKK